MKQASYKDAISEYKEQYLQKGFDEGFVMGVQRGKSMGKLFAKEVLSGESTSLNALIQLDESYLKANLKDISFLDEQKESFVLASRS